jgi:hypothetical protein
MFPKWTLPDRNAKNLPENRDGALQTAGAQGFNVLLSSRVEDA